jgi:hypothetical protein
MNPTLSSHPDEAAPYELFSEATARVTDVIRSKLSLFWPSGRRGERGERTS